MFKLNFWKKKKNPVVIAEGGAISKEKLEEIIKQKNLLIDISSLPNTAVIGGYTIEIDEDGESQLKMDYTQ